MSLIPAFEIGIWNAWIFLIFDIVTMPLAMSLINKRRSLRKEKFFPGLSKKDVLFHRMSKVTPVLCIIYSIFLPIKLGTIWFYIGLFLIVIGVILEIWVILTWIRTPNERHLDTGIYRYSRHPMYFSSFILFIGISIATVSWLFLLLSLIFITGGIVFSTREEELTIGQYGDSYRNYMKKTPKWIGIPKKR